MSHIPDHLGRARAKRIAARAIAPEHVEPASHAGRLVSADAYGNTYHLQSDIDCAWNSGRLEEKPASDVETFLVYH